MDEKRIIDCLPPRDDASPSRMRWLVPLSFLGLVLGEVAVQIGQWNDNGDFRFAGVMLAGICALIIWAISVRENGLA